MAIKITNGIYAITPKSIKGNELIDSAAAALDAGIDLLQYRFSANQNFDEIFQDAEKLQKLCKSHNKALIINDSYELAELLSSGLHIGQNNTNNFFLNCTKIKFIGISCHHNLKLPSRKVYSDFSYFSYGPVFNTQTKAMLTKPKEPMYFANKLYKETKSVAIGGINHINLKQVKRAGFTMAAICDAIFSQKDRIYRNSKNLIEIWHEN